MNWKKIVVILVFIAIIIGVRFSGIGEVLTFENLTENKNELISFVEANYLISAIAFILFYIIAIGLSFPGASLLTLTAGLLFGAIAGTFYVNIGATLGAFVAFLVARYLAGDWVESRYSKQLQKFNTELDTHGSNYLLTLRLIPIFPFFIINFLAGALKSIRPRTFLWTTSVGILPGSFAYAYAGFQLRTLSTLGDILSPGIISAFVLLGLFALIPAIYRKIHPKMSPAHKKQSPSKRPAKK